MELRINGRSSEDIQLEQIQSDVTQNSTQISQLTDNGAIAATVVLTQTEYNSLTPDANTIYIIVGA